MIHEDTIYIENKPKQLPPSPLRQVMGVLELTAALILCSFKHLPVIPMSSDKETSQSLIDSDKTTASFSDMSDYSSRTADVSTTSEDELGL